MIKHDKDIEVSELDFIDHRIIALNIKIFGFSIRLVNAYVPTESARSLLQKDNFYRSLKMHAVNLKTSKTNLNWRL